MSQQFINTVKAKAVSLFLYALFANELILLSLIFLFATYVVRTHTDGLVELYFLINFPLMWLVSIIKAAVTVARVLVEVEVYYD